MRLYEGAELPPLFKSVRQSRVISGTFTFQQAKIQNGDILAAIEG
jgi:hypothetical protein